MNEISSVTLSRDAKKLIADLSKFCFESSKNKDLYILRAKQGLSDAIRKEDSGNFVLASIFGVDPSKIYTVLGNMKSEESSIHYLELEERLKKSGDEFLFLLKQCIEVIGDSCGVFKASANDLVSKIQLKIDAKAAAHAMQSVTSKAPDVISYSEEKQLETPDGELSEERIKEIESFNKLHENDFYVSIVDSLRKSFDKDVPFYGPFNSFQKACLFSFLINNIFETNPSYASTTVRSGSEIIEMHKESDIFTDLSKAVRQDRADIPLHEKTKSYLSGLLTEGLTLSISGSGFDGLFNFLNEQPEIKVAFDQNNFEDILATLKNFFESEQTFIPAFKGYIKEHNLSIESSPTAGNKLDKEIPSDDKSKESKLQPSKKQETFNDNLSVLLKTTDELKGKKTTLIIDPQSNKISGKEIEECFEEIKRSFLSLDNVSYKEVDANPSGYFDILNNIFNIIFSKDFDSFQTLRALRSSPQNMLNIPGFTADDEFSAFYSLSQKIKSEPKIIYSIAGIITYVIISEEKERIRKNISYEIRKTGPGPYLSEDSVKEISDDIFELLLVSLKNSTKSILSNILSKLSFTANKARDILRNVRERISINLVISYEVKRYHRLNSEILNNNSLQLLTCSVCNQKFSTDKSLSALIERADQIGNYSFFKEDGTLLTEEFISNGGIKYKISEDALKLFPQEIARKTVIRGVKSPVVVTDYSWKEANDLMHSSSLLEQIKGQIIRMDILRYLGAKKIVRIDADNKSFTKSFFSSKNFCAKTLANLDQGIVTRTASNLEDGSFNYYKCMSKTDSVVSKDINEYLKSAYINPMSSASQNATPNGALGFRYARTYSKCPAILQSADFVNKRKETKQNLTLAVPKASPQLLKSQGVIDNRLIYHPPTLNNGDLFSEEKEAYFVCATNVSLSMFDRSRIQDYFKNILNNSGKEKLISVIECLIYYGVEINDLRPHIESILLENVELTGEEIVSSSSKIRIFDLFKKSKISLASSSNFDISDIKDLPLRCRDGHAFTLKQSYDFANTHNSLASQANLVKKDFINIVTENTIEKESTQNALFQKLIDLRLMTKYSKDTLIARGFKKINEFNKEQIEDLTKFVLNNKIYYETNDGICYSFPTGELIEGELATISSGKFSKNAWNLNIGYASTILTSYKKEFIEYAGGKVAIDSTGGSETDYELADQNEYDQEDESFILSKENREFLESRLDNARLLIPNIDNDEVEQILSNSLFIEKQFNENYQIFVSKFLKTFKVSRVWGLIAVNSQFDFISKTTQAEFEPRIEDPNSNLEVSNLNEIIALLNEQIVPMLEKIYFENTGGKTNSEEFVKSFLENFDFNGLLQRGVTASKFYGFATIAQYYAGFKVPLLPRQINKKGKQVFDPEAAKEMVKVALQNAVSQFISIYFSKTTGVTETVAKIADLLLSPYEQIFKKDSYQNMMENPIVSYAGKALVLSYCVDMINKINDVFSVYFFNRSSDLYLGPIFSFSSDFSRIISNLLSQTSNPKVANTGLNIPEFLLMEDSVFEENIKDLEYMLNASYKKEVICDDYIRFKGITSLKSEVMLQGLNTLILNKYSKIFEYASNSLDIISSEITSKRFNSPSVKTAAKILDQIADDLAERRFKLDFPNANPEDNSLLSAIRQAREEIGQTPFSTSSVVDLKIPLKSSNENFQNLVINSFSIKKFFVENTFFNIEKISSIVNTSSDNLNILEFQITSIGEFSHKDEVYHISIPDSVVKIQNKKEIVTTEQIPFSFDLLAISDDIIIPNEQTKDFLKRYSKDIARENDKILLIKNSLIKYKTASYQNVDEELRKKAVINNKFEIKITKISSFVGEGDPMWPPQNTLLFNKDLVGNIFNNIIGENINIYARLPHSKDVNSRKSFSKIYEDSLFMSDHQAFMANLKKFNTSYSEEKTFLPSSNLGVIIPFKLANTERKSQNISALGNYVNAKTVALVSSGISDKKIMINLSDYKSVDISWAFKTFDPQIEIQLKTPSSKKEYGFQSTLVQEGIVQKLDFLNRMMRKEYHEMKQKSPGRIGLVRGRYKVADSTYLGYLQAIINNCDNANRVENMSSFDDFLNELFSSKNANFIKFDIDPRTGVSVASLSEVVKSVINFCFSGETRRKLENVLVPTLNIIIDYYNASRVLNKEYNSLNPAVEISSDFVDIASGKDNQPSIFIRLLDPYSLWNMINNKMMRTQFGGQINDEDVEALKSFVISSFGIDTLCKNVRNETGINELTNEDLFDLPSFCMSYHNKYGATGAIKLNKLASLFGLVLEDGSVETYSNGFPVGRSGNAPLVSMDLLKNLGGTEFCLNEDSYISHSYATDFPRSMEIYKRIGVNPATGERTSAEETTKPEPETRVKRKPAEDVEKEKEAIKRKTLELFKKRIEELQNGTAKDITLETLALNANVLRETRAEQYNAMRKLVEELFSCFHKIYAKNSTANQKSLSWRKIAQIPSDEGGTMIVAAFEEWWAKYEEMASKIF